MAEPDRLDALTGEQARSWFMRHRRGGGLLLDAALTEIMSAFGTDVGYELVAPVNPRTRELDHLVVRVLKPADSEDAWDQLIQVQARLLERATTLSQQMRVSSPFDRFAITIFGAPGSWESVLETVERMD